MYLLNFKYLVCYSGSQNGSDAKFSHFNFVARFFLKTFRFGP